jgi:hypothetical protein
MPILDPNAKPMPEQQPLADGRRTREEDLPEDDAAPAAGAEGKEPDATRRVVLAGIKLLYDDATHADVMQQLKAGAENPAETIAQVAFNVMLALDEKSKGTLPEDAIVPGAEGVMKEIILLAQKSKALPVDDAILPAASQELVALAIESGLIDQADIEEMMASMDPAELEALVAEQSQIAEGRAAPPVAQDPAQPAQEPV